MGILQFFDFLLDELHHSNTFVLLLVSIVYLLTFENESKSVKILICCFMSVLIKVHRGTQISYVLQFFHEHRIEVFILIQRLFIFYTVS